MKAWKNQNDASAPQLCRIVHRILIHHKFGVIHTHTTQQANKFKKAPSFKIINFEIFYKLL